MEGEFGEMCREVEQLTDLFIDNQAFLLYFIFIVFGDTDVKFLTTDITRYFPPFSTLL